MRERPIEFGGENEIWILCDSVAPRAAEPGFDVSVERGINLNQVEKLR
jgi:hypothetical protein